MLITLVNNTKAEFCYSKAVDRIINLIGYLMQHVEINISLNFRIFMIFANAEPLYSPGILSRDFAPILCDDLL